MCDMKHEIIVRPATETDIPHIIELTDMARAFQRKLGFRQWNDGYPSVEIITSDIEAGGARVFMIDNSIAAYAFLVCGDSEYDRLPDNIWQHCGDYGVVHRLAVSDSFRGKRLSHDIFHLIELEFATKGMESVRVDTGLYNFVMRRVLDREGYSERGIWDFVWGQRVVYEKSL